MDAILPSLCIFRDDDIDDNVHIYLRFRSVSIFIDLHGLFFVLCILYDAETCGQAKVLLN